MDSISSKKILGISCFYHDSSATLIVDGEIKAAAQEERFTRKKHDSNFPVNSIKFCLSKENLTFKDIDSIFLMIMEQEIIFVLINSIYLKD